MIIHFLLRNPELVQNTHNCRYKHVNLSLLIYFTTLILSQSLAYSSWSQNFKKPKLILFSFKRLVELLPTRFGFYLFDRRNKSSAKPKYKQGLVSINCGLICHCYAKSPYFLLPFLLHPNNPSLRGQDNDICGEQELCGAEGGHIITDPGGCSHGQCQEAHAM